MTPKLASWVKTTGGIRLGERKFLSGSTLALQPVFDAGNCSAICRDGHHVGICLSQRHPALETPNDQQPMEMVVAGAGLAIRGVLSLTLPLRLKFGAKNVRVRDTSAMRDLCPTRVR
jgi:hypothetical protein